MLEEMRLFARQSWIPVILDDSLEYIENMLSKKSVKSILEIGTAIGYSAICFSKFLTNDGKIDTIEIDKQRIMLAKANIDMYKLNDKINVIEGDALKVLPKLNKKYDFIFLDPPYGKDMGIEAISLLDDITDENSVIILETDSTDNVPDKIDMFYRYDTRKYGRVVISFFKKEGFLDGGS